MVSISIDDIKSSSDKFSSELKRLKEFGNEGLPKTGLKEREEASKASVVDRSEECSSFDPNIRSGENEGGGGGDGTWALGGDGAGALGGDEKAMGEVRFGVERTLPDEEEASGVEKLPGDESPEGAFEDE